jgi:transposase
MWLAELLAHGLIRASFVPDAQTQEIRNLLRTRKQLVREQASHVLRVQKTLEDANIKLDSALTDVMGKSGRAMIEALIAGETNPAKLASLADRRVKASPEQLREALRGRVTKHHRFLLRLHLNQIDALEAAMATIDAQVEDNLGPFRTAVELIMSIRGIKNLSAHVIVSEIGVDMSRFPSAAHLISWACVCPRNDESAGKRRSTRVRKGANWLKTTLSQCALEAPRKKASYFQAQFHRIKARRGPKKAIMAVVASMLTAIYHMLKDGTMYHDLGCRPHQAPLHRPAKETPGQALVRSWLCDRAQTSRCIACGTGGVVGAWSYRVSFFLKSLGQALVRSWLCGRAQTSRCIACGTAGVSFGAWSSRVSFFLVFAATQGDLLSGGSIKWEKDTCIKKL